MEKKRKEREKERAKDGLLKVKKKIQVVQKIMSKDPQPHIFVQRI